MNEGVNCKGDAMSPIHPSDSLSTSYCECGGAESGQLNPKSEGRGFHLDLGGALKAKRQRVTMVSRSNQAQGLSVEFSQ